MVAGLPERTARSRADRVDLASEHIQHHLQDKGKPVRRGRFTYSLCAVAKFAEVDLACAGEKQQSRCPRRRNRTQDARGDAGRYAPRPLRLFPRTTCTSWLSSACMKNRAQGDSARRGTRIGSARYSTSWLSRAYLYKNGTVYLPEIAGECQSEYESSVG